jgi:hypothetical protein
VMAGRTAGMTAVFVLAEVDVKVDKAGPGLTVVVPVEGGMSSETRRHHRDHRHQSRTQAPTCTADQLPKPRHRHPTIVPACGTMACDRDAGSHLHGAS